MTFSKDVKLCPWVGEDYEKSSPKVLVLGESMVGKPDGKKQVIKFIRSIAEEQWRASFTTKIQDIVSISDEYFENDKGEYDLDVKMFWNRVAFYDFVQEPMETREIRPTKEQFISARKPFVEVVKALAPDIIVCLGKATFSYLPEDGQEKKAISIKNGKMDVWVYNYAGKNTYVCGFAHPASYGFKKEVWIKLYEKFLKTV